MRELAKNPRVVAIGETGLDYHRLPSEKILKPLPAWIAEQPLNDPVEPNAAVIDGAYKARQANLFEQQLDLAAELGLNVVIHQRDAWDDTLDILQAFAGKVRGVFHCFGGSLEQANQVIGLDHLVSFTGIVTFKNGMEVREISAQIPLHKFMVETDCPYLAPVPFRGKRMRAGAHQDCGRNDCGRARHSLTEIANATTTTAESFFRFNRG